METEYIDQETQTKEMNNIPFMDLHQTHQLATYGFIDIDGTRYYRRRGYDTILQAENGKQRNDIIVQNTNRVFLLTPNHKDAAPVRPGLAAY